MNRTNSRRAAATHLFWKRCLSASLVVLTIMLIAALGLADPVLCCVAALAVVVLQAIRIGAYLWEASKWH